MGVRLFQVSALVTAIKGEHAFEAVVFDVYQAVVPELVGRAGNRMFEYCHCFSLEFVLPAMPQTYIETVNADCLL
jgi:hypothetical protein